MMFRQGLKAPFCYFILLLTVSIFLTACNQGRMVIASFRATDHFTPLAADKRIFYEPGAETYANEIARVLPEAIHKVERAHDLPFKDSIAVYVCASIENCYRQTGHQAPAIVTNKLFISPALFQENKPIDLYLTHELSHLHLLQRLGTLKSLKLPAWFKEGFAEFVSGGATGAPITDEDAIKSISMGQQFVPDEDRSMLATFLSPRYGSHWNLSEPMFYHQSMLFIKYLYISDETAFHKMLIKIQAGESFGNALSIAYGHNLASLWNLYLQSIKAKG